MNKEMKGGLKVVMENISENNKKLNGMFNQYYQAQYKYCMNNPFNIVLLLYLNCNCCCSVLYVYCLYYALLWCRFIYRPLKKCLLCKIALKSDTKGTFVYTRIFSEKGHNYFSTFMLHRMFIQWEQDVACRIVCVKVR